MTFRVLVRRIPNQQPYTFALCNSLSEVDEAADLAELVGWPLVEVEEITRRPWMPWPNPLAVRQVEPVKPLTLWERLWNWFFRTEVKSCQ